MARASLGLSSRNARPRSFHTAASDAHRAPRGLRQKRHDARLAENRVLGKPRWRRVKEGRAAYLQVEQREVRVELRQRGRAPSRRVHGQLRLALEQHHVAHTALGQKYASDAPAMPAPTITTSLSRRTATPRPATAPRRAGASRRRLEALRAPRLRRTTRRTSACRWAGAGGSSRASARARPWRGLRIHPTVSSTAPQLGVRDDARHDSHRQRLGGVKYCAVKSRYLARAMPTRPPAARPGSSRRRRAAAPAHGRSRGRRRPRCRSSASSQAAALAHPVDGGQHHLRAASRAARTGQIEAVGLAIERLAALVLAAHLAADAEVSPAPVSTSTSTSGSRSASTAAFLMPWYISMVQAFCARAGRARRGGPRCPWSRGDRSSRDRWSSCSRATSRADPGASRPAGRRAVLTSGPRLSNLVT